MRHSDAKSAFVKNGSLENTVTMTVRRVITTTMARMHALTAKKWRSNNMNSATVARIYGM
jgi:hypothetical protein